MSLRLRFVLILLLAIVAVGAAALAILQLEAQTQGARTRVALDNSDELLRQLGMWIKSKPQVGQSFGSDSEKQEAHRFAASLVADHPEISLGYCDARGIILTAASNAVYLPLGSSVTGYDLHAPSGLPLSDRGGDGLLPADRNIVSKACLNASLSETRRTRASLPRDLLIVSSKAIDPSVSAFVLVRLAPDHPSAPGWLWAANIAIIGLSTLLLVIFCIDAIVALHQGAESLAIGIERLKSDLGAEVPTVRTKELAEVGAGIRAMASHLARAKEKRLTLERELNHRERLAGLGRVVAGVAHEVRTPLTGIKLKLDGMARRKLDDRSNRDIAICLEEIARLNRVVTSLLVVGRKGKSDKQVLDLVQFVDEKLERLGETAREKGIVLSRSGETQAPFNPEDLSRVLDNLIKNAIEESPANEKVCISLESTELDGTPCARITVSDKGFGLPPDRLGELFEPFFTLKPEGTGLGLFMSRALVEAQSGRLLYERTDNLTLFSIYLPFGV